MTPLVEAALDYLSAGLSIIALTGKQPNTEYHPHGLREPMSGVPEAHLDFPHERFDYPSCPGCVDAALISRVFEDPKTTGVGIVIEYPYCVVDIDGEAGAKTFLDLVPGDIDATAVARTARGLHLWYSDTAPRRSARLGDLLDLKGQGGYVAAPPSKHPDGAVYTWLTPMVVDGSVQPIMELPDAIKRLLADQANVTADLHQQPKPVYHVLQLRDGKLRMVPEEGSLAGLVYHVKNLRPGNRNSGLHWAANVAREEGFTLADTLAELLPASTLDPREARTAIRSAFNQKGRP